MLLFHGRIVFMVILILQGCTHNYKTAPRFELMTATGINFQNKVEDNTMFNIFTYRNFYNGAGVAIGDINNDNLPDVFFTSNMGSNKLYVNKGNFKFEDISSQAGFGPKQKWSTGVVMVDLNADNWLDIYVCNAGYQKGVGQQNELYINNKNGTFTEQAMAYGLDDSSFTTHAAFFDYDLDGDLDCYLLNNSFIPVNTLNYSNKRQVRAKDWPVEEFIKGGGDKLLRNDNNKFTDVSEPAGIYGSLIGFGLGVTVGDVTGDNYPDMYISNDFFERDYLYINQRDGTFKEELEERMQHISLSSMGADMADINNDDYPDIFVTDMLPDSDLRLKTTSSYDNIDVQRLKERQGFYHQYMQNTLQVNNQMGNFYETAYYSGVARSDWSWGGLIFDADNDGLSDIYVCNGIYHDVTDQDFIDFFADEIIQRMVLTGEKEEVSNIISKMPSVPQKNKAFKNRGNLKFTDEGDNWGFSQPSFSNGAAYADLDNDGDLDLIVNNVNEPSFIYRNNSERDSANYLSVLLKGNGNNTFSIGAKIKVYAAGQVISREVIPSRGFQSSCDYKQIVGLGKLVPDSMIVFWPNNLQSKIINPAINQHHTLDAEKADTGFIKYKHQPKPLFALADSFFQNHIENPFIDFYYERNIPVMMSGEGPKAAVGDVNGDGLDDVFICGAKGSAGQVYFQNRTSFLKSAQLIIEKDKDFEDVSCQFSDIDNDGDLDLIVGSGGNTVLSPSPLLQTRIYKNDGAGNFSRDASCLLPAKDNAGVVLAHDFDSDGDVDLFIGGRNKPQSYGLAPESSFYQNDGKGGFTDATRQWCPQLNKAGMITDARLANLTGDKKPELIITGEWMEPVILEWKDKSFSVTGMSIPGMNGWWQTVTVADLDNDLDDDLILGNYGLNFYLQPTTNNPVKLFINDFDNNSIPDKILSRTIDGRDLPVFLKRELQDQMPSLKKENLRHADFATKSVQELLDKNVLKTSTVKEINQAASVVVWNEGNGKFAITPLPYLTQLSSINAIALKDMNNDGFKDLLLAGNQFHFLPQFSRLDASYGWVLINNKNRSFEPLQQQHSGLLIKGAVRDIKEITINGQSHFLFLQNNNRPLLYKFNGM